MLIIFLLIILFSFIIAYNIIQMIYQWLKTKKKKKKKKPWQEQPWTCSCLIVSCGCLWLCRRNKRGARREILIKLGQYGNWVSNKLFMLVFSLVRRDGFLWTQVENGWAPPKNFLSFSPYQTTLTSILSHLFSIHPTPSRTKHTLKLTWAKRVGSSQNIPLPWEPSTHLTNNYL